VYTWALSGKGIITGGQGTHVITVDWQGSGPGKVWVSEKSITRTDVCEGISDTLAVWIEPPPGPEDIAVRSVSVQADEEKNIQVRFRITPAAKVEVPVTLSRRTLLPEAGNWSPVASLQKRDSLYTDQDLLTDEQVYEYRLDGRDNCGLPLVVGPHHSILLSGAGDEPKELVQLNWNSYTGWPGGVKEYQIWRKLDDQTSFSLYQTVGKNQSGWTGSSAKEAFLHCFRIRAIEEGGSGGYSLSNEVRLQFEHPLFIPNVITPNGDNYNDTWVIANLDLYRDYTLTIVNRYGKEVFRTSHYLQDWNGDGHSPGIYYYLLTSPRYQKTIRGWVQVLR
jgi:gliding motility-associated-like protein